MKAQGKIIDKSQNNKQEREKNIQKKKERKQNIYLKVTF